MKKRYTKKINLGNKTNGMFSVGWGKSGPYAYAGIKKNIYSVGASIGTKGRQIYVSATRKSNQVRVKYNLENKNIFPRFKKFK